MSNDELLQKLLLGKDAVENFTITIDDEEISGTMRPLTSGELTKLQSLEKKGFVMKIGVDGKGKRKTVSTNTDVDINAGEFNEFQAEAMYQAIAWSMGWDIEDIKQMRAGYPEELFKEVIRISQLTEEDLTLIKSFRK